jgi:hypothetical protein
MAAQAKNELLMDMCKYSELDGSTELPPDDTEDDRMKSPEAGEWRLATVERKTIFSGYPKEDACLVLGYGRVTVLLQYPAEEFHEFAMWEPSHSDWNVRDVHWQHPWQPVL